MNIYGVDFTSAPKRQKPITCLPCRLEHNVLQPDQLIKIASLNEFEIFLKRRGPWVAGFDFPFGQPRRLIDELGWPEKWAEYVAQVAAMSLQEFEELLASYRNAKPKGHKHLKRQTDVVARSISPMMLFGVPVGKMFFRGAPRLLRAGISVLPCYPTQDQRIALEAYPALVARKWLGNPPKYKNDSPQKQTAEQQAARRRLIAALRSQQLADAYGLRLDLDDAMADDLAGDPSADSLDALLCAIQAAWAYLQRDDGYSIPPNCDPDEGWIVDPETRKIPD